MAQSPRKPAKSRASGKSQKTAPTKSRAPSRASAKGQAASKSRATSKQRAAPKRMPSPRGDARVSKAPDRSWTETLQTLVTSSLGREILADVLEASAGALRKARTDAQDAMEAGALATTAAGQAATSVGTEMATGAAALVQTATETLADLVTSTASSLIPPGEESEPRRSPRRGAKGRGKASKD